MEFDIIKLLVVALIGLVGWLGSYIISRSDKGIKEIQEIKNNYISRRELREHLDTLNKNIKDIEKNLSEKLDAHLLNIDLKMQLKMLQSKDLENNKA